MNHSWIKSVFLFVLALFSILYFGKRNKMPDSVRKVLFVQLSQLGDMVCFTPVFHALRMQRPEVKIAVLGNTINRELLAGNPDVDEYILYEKRKIFAATREIRKKRFDVAVVRGVTLPGLLMALFAGVPVVVASHIPEGRSLQTRTHKILLRFVHAVPLYFGRYMPRQFLRLLEPLGILSDDTTKRLRYSKEAAAAAERLYQSRGIDPKKDFVVGITPSAGNKIKEWPEERFAALAAHLMKEHHAKVVLFGGPSDGEKVRRVREGVKSTEAVMEVVGGSIDELKALIADLSLFISADTGPLYIAEAFGVPTVDIVGPMDEREQPPQGLKHRVVVPPQRARPEISVLNSRFYNEEEAKRQTLSITVPMVTDVVDKLLEDLFKKGEGK